MKEKGRAAKSDSWFRRRVSPKIDVLAKYTNTPLSYDCICARITIGYPRMNRVSYNRTTISNLTILMSIDDNLSTYNN